MKSKQFQRGCLVIAGLAGFSCGLCAAEEIQTPNPSSTEAPAHAAAPPKPSSPTQAAKPSSGTGALDVAPARLSCKASRVELGIFEPLRILSITIDVRNKYVKMVQESDGKTFEYGDPSQAGAGTHTFVKVTDDNVVYGRARESWKIDRYTGTLTNPSIGFHFECQLKAAERKF